MKRNLLFVLIMGLLVLTGCTGSQIEMLNDKGAIKTITKKNGIEMTVEMDKSKYTKNEKIVIYVKAKNLTKKDIEYSGPNCYDGFTYDTNKRLYSKGSGEEGVFQNVCPSVARVGILKSGEEAKKIIRLFPREGVDDHHLYPGEKLSVKIGFLGTKTEIDLPVEIETKKRGME